MKRSRRKLRVDKNRILRIAALLCAVAGVFVSIGSAYAEETGPAAEKEKAKPTQIKQGVLVEPTQGPIVVLGDGGLIVARSVGIVASKKKDQTSRRKLLLDSEIFGRIELPTGAVAGILFHPPPGIEARDASVAKLLADHQQKKRRTDDRVTLVNGDQLDGPLLGIKNRRIAVETAFGRTDIKITQIVSIVFGSKKTSGKSKKEAPHKRSKYFTGWSDGSRFAVAKFLKGKKTRLQVWRGDEKQNVVPKPWTAKADQLRFVQPLGDETIVYLSDLTPSDYKHVPFLDRQLELGIDRNVLGRPLRSGGLLYPKGLGTASRSTIAYTLAEPFSRFEASLAIDDSTDGRGSVFFRVLLDGKTVYTSPTIRGGQKPVPISIDVTGAKLLELEVDYADQGDQLDRANWLEARLGREKEEPRMDAKHRE